jgi:hypothetical protein
MPIIITYLNPNMRPDAIEGESWGRLDADSPRMGTINLKSLGDGHRIIVNKSAVAKVEEYPQAVWDANIETQRKAAEEKQWAKQEKAEAERDAAAETRKFKNRVRRFFRWGRIVKPPRKSGDRQVGQGD